MRLVAVRCWSQQTPLAKWLRDTLLLLTWWAATAAAADFRTLSAAAAARLAPSDDAPIAFYYRPGTPVEVIQERDGWAQVRDKEGDGLYWVAATSLLSQRTVITLRPDTEVRSAPDPRAALLMLLPENSVVPLKSTAIPGWVEVQTPKGPGFIAKRDVWGW